MLQNNNKALQKINNLVQPSNDIDFPNAEDNSDTPLQEEDIFEAAKFENPHPPGNFLHLKSKVVARRNSAQSPNASVDSPEYRLQKLLCEHHKKIAFDTARAMIEDEIFEFRACDSDSAGGSEFKFTKTCLKQNFFDCILD